MRTEGDHSAVGHELRQMPVRAVKSFKHGTHRLIPPAETLSRVRGLFGAMGITRVANVTGLDCIGIPVVMTCRPNARSLAVSQGKGCDLDAARASGVMEAIELYHAERISKPLLLASWNELRFSRAVIPIEGLPQVSGSLFHPDRQLLWIEGVDLYSLQPVWLPYELVHTNFTLPVPTGSGCFAMSSNGLASGNHPLEAIIHGLCEVIERDGLTLHLLRTVEEQDVAQLDLATVKDPECTRLLEKYERAGVAVAVWDITSDVGIATFRCTILDRNPSPLRRLGPVEGAGCHPVREVALLRALTEAAQGRLTLIAGSRDDNGRARYRETQDVGLIARARSRLAFAGTRSFEGVPTTLNDTLEDDVANILAALRSVGFPSAIAIDLTKPEFDIPIVRLVVSGLETYHHIQGVLPGERALRILKTRSKERCK
jgi:ribosomal protein S12 methylthiotransferase accessory factor